MKMLVLVASCLFLGGLAGCGLPSPAANAPILSAQPAPTRPPDAPELTVQPKVPGPTAPLEVPGRARCMLARRGIIASAILRPVVEVLVGPGDRVTKGQVLIKLFDLEPQAKIRAREKELRSIEARARL